MSRVRVFFGRMVRTVALVIRDERIPRPLRWAGGVALLPIPGPFDEAVLLVVAAPLFVFYRGQMREAWRASLADAPVGAQRLSHDS